MYEMDNFVDYLPFCYRNEYISEILRCLQIEVEKLFNDIAESELDYRVETANEKILEWSSLVGIDVDKGADLQTQREQILSAMKSNDITTAKLIKSIVESYSNATCEVIENYNDYSFKVKFVDKVGIPKRLDLVKLSIDKFKPAHLNYDFEFKYRTWGDIKAYGKTWDYYKDKKLTWNDLKGKEDI